MPNIGVVLSGCAGKGAFEVGCLQAIIDYFGKDQIQCVSSASMGALIGHAYGMGRETQAVAAYRDMDAGKFGRHIMGFANKQPIIALLSELFSGENKTSYEHFVSVWNFTKSRVEYVPFHELPADKLLLYLRGAVSIPIFTTGVVVDGNRLFDGAFLDNIPVFPLVKKNLDYVFCVYFDNHRYLFESPEFDRKVVKLYDFPNRERLRLLSYQPGSYDSMRGYAYQYTMDRILKIFEAQGETPVEAIARLEKESPASYGQRLTADVVLNNINVMTNRYFKKQSFLKKLK